MFVDKNYYCTSAFVAELSSPLVVVAEPEKRHANILVLCWSGITGTEHFCSYERRGRSVCFFL